MSDGTPIEWADATWNPLRARNRATGRIGWHCEHAAEGCRFCYAETMNGWRGTRLPYKPGHRDDIEIFIDHRTLMQPLRWRAPRLVFVCSMTDLFGDFVTDEQRDYVFAAMALATKHTMLVLTKRPERMREYVSAWFERLAAYDPLIEHPAGRERFSRLVDWSVLPAVLPNVWLGTSCEDQATADARIPALLEAPAALHWVSLEPLLGSIDLTRIKEDTGYTFNALSTKPGISFRGVGLGWVIAGGENGPRPMHPDWPRQIRDDCADANVPFLFKQWGAWKHGSDFKSDAMAVLNDGRVIEPTKEALAAADREARLNGSQTMMRRVGKRAAGRELDGRIHDGFPERAIA